MCALCQLPTAHEREIIYTANYLKTLYLLNYIDPGTGSVIVSNLSAVLGIAASVFLSILFFLRNRIFPIFTKKWAILAIILIVVAGIMFGMNKMQRSSSTKSVLVLGFDGLDPNILQDGWRRGLFPNFKKVKDMGYFSKLETVAPPQSPVAWASFATGAPPSKHGIYDFIERNPKDYSLNLVFSQKDQRTRSAIKATPFWQILTKNNIPQTILFLPDTFEPPKSLSGELLSGMGVPDILGTQGTFTLFTTRHYPTNDYTWRGKVIGVENPSAGGRIKTNIEGPKYSLLNETKTAKIPIEIKILQKDAAEIKVQGKTVKLKRGQFSDWVKLEFKIDFFTKAKGIAKFYLKSVKPDFELYLSPINFDPDAPLRPISTPYDFSKQLSKQFGLFSTLGLPHDTWALEEDVFDEKAFLTQADSILSERRKIYYSKLDSFKNGILFAYFGMPDTISHMFWRFKDKGGPYGNIINEYYQKMDEIVGETLKKMRKDDTLIILSDHGFYAFDYEMNVNTFLLENGFLVLKEGAKKSGPLYKNVNWKKTRAFAAGYNSVYFNIKDREKDGIVEEEDRGKLEQEIIAKLMEVTNQQTNQKVMKKVYARHDLGIAKDDPFAPDLILGFYKGTRTSWDSAIGAVLPDVIRKRQSKWSGDHLFDPSEVPGVLFVNKKANLKNPKITDAMPEILKLFGVKM